MSERTTRVFSVLPSQMPSTRLQPSVSNPSATSTHTGLDVNAIDHHDRQLQVFEPAGKP